MEVPEAGHLDESAEGIAGEWTLPKAAQRRAKRAAKQQAGKAASLGAVGSKGAEGFGASAAAEGSTAAGKSAAGIVKMEAEAAALTQTEGTGDAEAAEHAQDDRVLLSPKVPYRQRAHDDGLAVASAVAEASSAAQAVLQVGVADSKAKARVTEAVFVEAGRRAVDKLNALRDDVGLQRELVALVSTGQVSLEDWLGLGGVL